MPRPLEWPRLDARRAALRRLHPAVPGALHAAALARAAAASGAARGLVTLTAGRAALAPAPVARSTLLHRAGHGDAHERL